MREEVKELLKDELKAISKSKTSIIVGVTMIILDVVLVLTSLLSIYSLIFTLPLLFLVRKSYNEYQLNQAMLIFTRMLVDDEFEPEK
jgi:capsule polysaccharide export protein KpsE/RkpR